MQLWKDQGPSLDKTAQVLIPVLFPMSSVTICNSLTIQSSVSFICSLSTLPYYYHGLCISIIIGLLCRIVHVKWWSHCLLYSLHLINVNYCYVLLLMQKPNQSLSQGPFTKGRRFTKKKKAVTRRKNASFYQYTHSQMPHDWFSGFFLITQ